MDLLNKLKKIIKGEVTDSSGALKKYSHDASLFEVKPEVIVMPKNAEDIGRLVRFVSEIKSEKVFITPRSGGTDMSGGDLGESIIVDVSKHLNKIKSVSSASATVEPGVFYRDFERETLKQGALLPSYPASREICTVGGMVANNSGGEKTLAYGKTEDYVAELKAVFFDGNEYTIKPLNKKELTQKTKLKTAEGKIYRGVFNLIKKNAKIIAEAKPKVSKNSAGYYLWNVWDGERFDLTKLLVGSQGTLGIITEATFRLIKPKKYSKLLVIFLRDLAPLAKIVSKVLEYKPESFESFDDNTLWLAIRYLPSLIRLMKPKNLLSLVWQFLPEVGMVLTGGFPKLVLIAEFTGESEKEVAAVAEKARAAIAGMGLKTRVTKSPEEARK